MKIALDAQLILRTQARRMFFAAAEIAHCAIVLPTTATEMAQPERLGNRRGGGPPPRKRRAVVDTDKAPRRNSRSGSDTRDTRLRRAPDGPRDTRRAGAATQKTPAQNAWTAKMILAAAEGSDAGVLVAWTQSAERATLDEIARLIGFGGPPYDPRETSSSEHQDP